MNLPNSITVARIAVMPLVAALPFVESWEWRLAGFVLYILAAVTGEGVFDTLKAVSKLVLKALA